MATNTNKWNSLSIFFLVSIFLTACLVGCSGSSGSAAQTINHPWTATGSLNIVRTLHQSTLLPNGKVLVSGGSNRNTSGVSVFLTSAELYDPATGTWSATGSLATGRVSHTATLLPNGKVLVSGGAGPAGAVASAELYDSTTGIWTATGSLATARYAPKATLLSNGKVLVSGGASSAGQPIASAELYDPATGTWAATGSLIKARFSHTSNLLSNGKVLVAGGAISTNYATSSVISNAELYDPATGTWTATGSLATARESLTSNTLPNGKVLVTGGDDSVLNGQKFSSAELYDPATGTWTATGSLATGRSQHTATVMTDGTVLVTGGYAMNIGYTASAEVYDPATGNWTATGSLKTGRLQHTAILLPSGTVLVSAGYDNTGNSIATAELY